MDEVIAKNSGPVFLVGPSLLAVLFGSRVMQREFDVDWWWSVLIVGAVVAVFVWVVSGWSPRALVLTPEALHVRRRYRPWSIARNDIRSVHGDVPDRPSWSTKVIVETKDRAVTLPNMAQTELASVIERVQAWSETDQNSSLPEGHDSK